MYPLANEQSKLRKMDVDDAAERLRPAGLQESVFLPLKRTCCVRRQLSEFGLAQL